MTWSRSALDRLHAPSALRPGDPGWSAYTSDVVLEGRPDLVVRPRTEEEIAALLAEAGAQGIPVTFAGGQTSLTGSSVAEEGILVATDGMTAILDLAPDPETGGMTATAEPGVFLGDFQRALAAEGWLYPPDPTSRNEARLGATVATNATGEDTLLYGPTRRWVRELRVVTADGAARTLRRSPHRLPLEEKATAGYYLWGEPIDLIIGSEGTLAAVTRVTVDVVPLPSLILCGLAFFPDLASAAAWIVRARRTRGVRPRALELMDRASLELARDNPEGIRWPAGTGAAVYFKQESRDETERDARLEAWAELVETGLREAGAPSLADATVIVEGARGLDRMREFRHRIPARLHEIVRGFRDEGGGKLGTDWWVPYPLLPAFLERWRPRLERAAVDHVVFGHAGNGHPHVNFLPRNGDEMETARHLALAMCREAVAAGGGVAGEHGLGKLKRDLLAVQYPDGLEAMRRIKREWDPREILGRGNILPPEQGRTAS